MADPAETRSRCRNARNIRNRLARTPVHRSACKSAKLDVLIDSRVAVLREEFDRAGNVQRPRRTKDFRCRVENSKRVIRSEEHTSELQSLMRISYAVFCLKKKTHTPKPQTKHSDESLCNPYT